jgi:hypothetical protein
MPIHPPKFSKPSRKSREEPSGLDDFAAGVPGAVRAVVPSPSSGTDYLAAPEASRAPQRPTKERETLGMNVRFTRGEKAILEALAQREGRSMHQVLKRLLQPVLKQAADGLEFGS